jgi:hypothetical protein
MFDGDHSSNSYRTKPHPYKDKDLMTRISAPLLILFTQREDTACQLVGRRMARKLEPMNGQGSVSGGLSGCVATFVTGGAVG